jgi:hypothetical protein
MASNLYDTVNELAELSRSRNPGWEYTTASGSNGIPTSSTDGVGLDGAVSALWQIKPRLNNSYRTVIIIPNATNIAAGTTYTIDVAGASAASATGFTSVPLLIANLVADMSANTTVDAQALDLDDDGNADAIMLTGKAIGGYSVEIATSGSTGTWTATGDAEDVTVTFWALPTQGTSGDDVAGWSPILSARAIAIDEYGATDALDNVNGYDRLYAKVTLTGHADDANVTPTCSWAFAPLMRETD